MFHYIWKNHHLSKFWKATLIKNMTFFFTIIPMQYLCSYIGTYCIILIFFSYSRWKKYFIVRVSNFDFWDRCSYALSKHLPNFYLIYLIFLNWKAFDVLYNLQWKKKKNVSQLMYGFAEQASNWLEELWGITSQKTSLHK